MSDIGDIGAVPAPTGPGCWCDSCDVEWRSRQRGPAGLPSRFIVCPDCGNKRCPRATHHDLACTGSNEPNQPGSRYQYPPAAGPG